VDSRGGIPCLEEERGGLFVESIPDRDERATTPRTGSLAARSSPAAFRSGAVRAGETDVHLWRMAHADLRQRQEL